MAQLSQQDIDNIVKELPYVEIYPTNELCCGACQNFQYEDTDGYGLCAETGLVSYCGGVCKNFKS